MLQQSNHANNHQQMQQQQQRTAYPQPPRLNRPASVLLEPSTAFHSQQTVTRPRSQSQAVYSSYVPPPTITTQSTSGNSGNGGNSSSANTGHDSASGNDTQHRLQNWRPPTHKSKLSKQYTPSEDSDDESTGEKAAARRRSKYMSGAALELNTGPGNEASRARAQSNASQTSVLDNTDAASLNSLRSTTKKLSLGKRISSFFRGSTNNSNNNDNNSSPVSSLTQSLTNAAAAALATEDSGTSRSRTPSLTPIDELAPPDRAHSVYIHQRSHSSPDHVGSTGYGHFKSLAQSRSQNSTMEDGPLRTARDSGFEEASGRGHRRHSSSVVKGGAAAHGPSVPQPQPYQPSLENPQRSSHYHKNEGLCIDQKQQHRQQQHHQPQQQQQQIRQPTTHLQLSTSSPQLPSHVDHELHLPTPQRQNNRHSFMGTTDMVYYPPQNFSATKRGNTSVGFASSSSSSDTLISKVDREKASICFQAPSAKKETFTRDAHLDPALSSLVQQHRKDFKTNQRLGGTPQLAPQPHSPQFPGHSPRQRGSVYLLDDPHQVLPPSMLVQGSRRDSNGSQSHGHPSASSPGLYGADTQMKRLSTGSQYLQQTQLVQQQHPNYPYFTTQGNSSSGITKLSASQGSLSLQQPAGLYFDQAIQSSPLAGPIKTSSPRPQSSVGYFNAPRQQQQQQQQQHLQPQSLPSMLQISPLPSPSLSGLRTTGSQPEITTLQPTLQQQQQLEQLQQMRIQQQHVLAQQQQQYQHQLAQVGLGLDMMPAQTLGIVGLGAMALTATTPGAVSPLTLSPAIFQTPPTQMVHSHQNLQQQQWLMNSNNYTHGTTAAPMQTYPAGSGSQ